jgi:hypothetical protein
MVFIVIFLKLWIFITFGKLGGQRLLKYFIKGLFFNVFLAMAMEGYLEFTINGFLNVYTANTSLNGEILGITIASICIF